MIELHKLTACNLPEAPSITSHRVITAAVHYEMQPGTFLHVTLDEKGLLVARGQDQVLISLGEIVALATEHLPRLALLQLMVESEGSPAAARPTDDLRNK